MQAETEGTTYQEEREVVTIQNHQGEQIPLTIIQLENLQENVSIIEQSPVISSRDEIQVRSRLELHRLNKSDMGTYWCSVHLNYTIESLSKTFVVTASDSVLLGHPHDYAHEEQCITNIAQSKHENKCALSSSISPLPWLGGNGTTIPDSEVTETTPLSLAEHTTLVGDKKDEGKGHILKEFYIALGILITFGSIIAVLVLVVVITCLQYRKMLKGMETQ